MSAYKVSHEKGTNLVTVHAENFDGPVLGTFNVEDPNPAAFTRQALAEVKNLMAENEVSNKNLSVQITPAAYTQANTPVREAEEAFADENAVVGNQVVPGRSSVENSTQVVPVETQTLQSRDTHKEADLKVKEDKVKD